MRVAVFVLEMVEERVMVCDSDGALEGVGEAVRVWCLCMRALAVARRQQSSARRRRLGIALE